MKSSVDRGGFSSIPRWVNTVLVVLIGYALATLSMKAVSQTDFQVAALTVDSGTKTDVDPGLDILGIGRSTAANHLFGDAGAKPEKIKKIKVNTPRPAGPSNLKLAGVFAYEPAERAIAIIGTPQGENAFRVGDVVVRDIKLKAVFPDHVVLDNRGREEVLRLPENVAPIATPRPIQQSRNSTIGSGGSVQANSGPIDLPSTPGALRDTLAKNPSILGRVVSAEPYKENGKLVGYRITPKQNPEILEAQGIVAGDIITRVNNIDLNSQKQGIRALRNAVKAQSLDVTVMRNGVEVPISISLAE